MNKGRSNRERKQTTLIITHDEKTAEQCDRIIFLRDSKIISDDSDSAQDKSLRASFVHITETLLSHITGTDAAFLFSPTRLHTTKIIGRQPVKSTEKPASE